MTNYERLLELEKQDNTEILAKNNITNDEYIINSTVKGEVALFHVDFADGSKDIMISADRFNSEFTIL